MSELELENLNLTLFSSEVDAADQNLTLRNPALGGSPGVAWGLGRSIPGNGVHTPQPSVQRASRQEGRLRDSLVISEFSLLITAEG